MQHNVCLCEVHRDYFTTYKHHLFFKDSQQKLEKIAEILGIITTLLNQLWSRNFQE